jgi:hypothetical protein
VDTALGRERAWSGVFEILGLGRRDAALGTRWGAKSRWGIVDCSRCPTILVRKRFRMRGWFDDEDVLWEKRFKHSI